MAVPATLSKTIDHCRKEAEMVIIDDRVEIALLMGDHADLAEWIRYSEEVPQFVLEREQFPTPVSLEPEALRRAVDAIVVECPRPRRQAR
jgi:hypothetical protein